MNVSGSKLVIASALTVLAVVIGLLLFAVFENSERVLLIVNGERVPLRVADNAIERYRGLSGVSFSDLDDFGGMVFLFADEEARTFVMRDMEFDLDIVWVKDGKVVGIERGVPAPEPGQEPESVTSEPLKVDTVIELPAGGAAKLGLLPGVAVKFSDE